MNDNLPAELNEYGNIEIQVIGEIFKSEDAAVMAFEALTMEDFRDSFSAVTFKIAKSRFEQGKPFDAYSVSEDYASPGEGRKALRNYLESCVSFENFAEHIQIVKRNAMRRRMAAFSQEAQEFSWEPHTIGEMQTFLSDAFAKFDDGGIRQEVGMAEGLQNFFDNIGVEREYLKTGLSPIDQVLHISKGDYIVLGARPSVGKTAFALQIATTMSTSHKVVFYSFETSTTKIYDRIIARLAGIDFQRVVAGKLTDFDKELIQLSIKMADKWQFEAIEASGMTVSEIQASAVRKKADIIFIDYIGLINPGEAQPMSSYETITKISKDLHTMAQKRKIAVFALSQLSRQGNEIPSLTNLRDSGQIEQDADAVLLLSRTKHEDDPTNESWRLVQIAKNKEGTLGQLDMYFEGDRQRFTPSDKNH